MRDTTLPSLSPKQVQDLYIADMTELAMGWKEGEDRFIPTIATMFLSSVNHAWIDAPLSRDLAGKPLHPRWHFNWSFRDDILQKRAPKGLSEVDRATFIGFLVRQYFRKTHHYFMFSNLYTTEAAQQAVQAGDIRKESALGDLDNEILWLEMFAPFTTHLPAPMGPPFLFSTVIGAERELADIYIQHQHKQTFPEDTFQDVHIAFLKMAQCLQAFTAFRG